MKSCLFIRDGMQYIFYEKFMKLVVGPGTDVVLDVGGNVDGDVEDVAVVNFTVDADVTVVTGVGVGSVAAVVGMESSQLGEKLIL